MNPQEPSHQDQSFGFVEPRSLEQIPTEDDFLSWGGDTNAAEIIPRYALDDQPASGPKTQIDADDTLDRLTLGHSLARYWRNRRSADSSSETSQGPGFLQLFDFHSQLKQNDSHVEIWDRAEEANALGSSHFHQNQREEALKAYQTALRLYESIGDVKGAGMCHGNIGLVHLHLGDPRTTATECFAALKAHVSVDYRRGQLMHLTNLALASMQVRQWGQALEIWGKREKLQRWVDPTQQSITLAQKAECHFRLGNTDEAETHYQEALAALAWIHTPARLQEAAGLLFGVASLIGQANPEEQIARSRQTLMGELQALRPECPPLAEPIVRRFQTAREKGNKSSLHQAIGQCPRWAVLAWEWVTATSALFEISGQGPTASGYLVLAEQMALGLCRSLHLRGPLDATKLYKCWNLEQRMAAAQAFSYKLGAMANAEKGDAEAAFQAMRESVRLYHSIGHRSAQGSWYQEWASELDFSAEDHTRMYQVVIRSKSRARDGDHDGALSDLETALAIAEDKGSKLNVADKLLRIAILHHQARRLDQAADWFRRAHHAFEALERLGPALRDEVGRSDNKIKMGIQLAEFLFDAGRFSEAIGVLQRCLLEIEWFLESPAMTLGEELKQRTHEFKTRGLYTLTQARYSMGSFQKALETGRQTLEWAEEIKDLQAKAVAYQGLSHTYLELALFRQAIEAATSDLEIQRELGDPREIAVSLDSLADAQLRSGDADGAVASCLDALKLLEDRDDVLRSTILAGLASAEEATGRLEESERHYREALELHQASGNVFGIISTRTTLAQLLLRQQGRLTEAEKLAEEAWQQSKGLQSHSVRAGAGYVLALAQMQEDSLQQWIDASNVLLEVCSLIDKMRSELHRESLRALQSSSRSAPYRLLVAALSTLALRTDSDDLRVKAFDAVERAKARSLVEALAREAQHRAEASGFESRATRVYFQDPTEMLPRVGFSQIHEMLVGEAETGD
jgi:tetratricopeptide (TPR) repeat protein